MMNYRLLFLAILLLMPASRSEAAASIKVTNDIPYGAHSSQKLDVYAPAGSENKNLPVLLFIHGGAWHTGDKSGHDDKGKFYAEKGIVFISINYRLAPDNIHPAQAQDTALAIKWTADHISDYGGDKNRLYLSGHSAGAHIAALVATDPEYLNKAGLELNVLKAVFPVDSANFDLTSPKETGKRLVERAISQNFGDSRYALLEASPLHHVREKTTDDFPPFVLFATSRRPDAVSQTQKFDSALRDAGTRSEYHVIEGLTHREINKAMADPASPVSQVILGEITKIH